jgi:predicted transcriptional regulator
MLKTFLKNESFTLKTLSISLGAELKEQKQMIRKQVYKCVDLGYLTSEILLLPNERSKAKVIYKMTEKGIEFIREFEKDKVNMARGEIIIKTLRAFLKNESFTFSILMLAIGANPIEEKQKVRRHVYKCVKLGYLTSEKKYMPSEKLEYKSVYKITKEGREFIKAFDREQINIENDKAQNAK